MFWEDLFYLQKKKKKEQKKKKKTCICSSWSSVNLLAFVMLISSLGCASHGFFCFFTESRRASIDIFIKAAGYLDCAVRHVHPQLPTELKFVSTENYTDFNFLFVNMFLMLLFLIFWLLLDCRRNLPVDLAEGVLRALCLQALGQVFQRMGWSDKLLHFMFQTSCLKLDQPSKRCIMLLYKIMLELCVFWSMIFCLPFFYFSLLFLLHLFQCLL